ncbi:AAA family ATPase [Nonomuraea basaltis]|uniref:AAA family ATPase n=1 Tax=Nonomuraea basaltis TaxID=2495887 RepID=UPI00110C4CB3|nr:ATP-binding protein [Nonomuraea basaltis]TMR90247.1 ATP-binding protein [Nonomuraea basaltis]
MSDSTASGESEEIAVGPPEEATPTVVMMCGIAGSGKTTYAQSLERRGYVRLSIDEAIWARFGRDAVEFDPEEYEDSKAAAEETLWDELVDLLKAGQPVVLDYSFWRRATRDRYKALIESHGRRWELIYLKANPETLRQRLGIRNMTHGANSVTVSGELLDRYLIGFEEPVDEGERTILQN